MKNRTEPLHPRFEGQLLRSKPRDMATINVSNDERVMLERQALSIFTEASNSGLPFRDCLVSILISGMDWGICASKEEAIKFEKPIDFEGNQVPV